MACLYLSHDPPPPLPLLRSWCSQVIRSPELPGRGLCTSDEIVSLAEEATRLKDQWLPRMKDEMRREEGREERKRSEILTVR
jgi:hypothetical protein